MIGYGAQWMGVGLGGLLPLQGPCLGRGRVRVGMIHRGNMPYLIDCCLTVSRAHLAMPHAFCLDHTLLIFLSS